MNIENKEQDQAGSSSHPSAELKAITGELRYAFRRVFLIALVLGLLAAPAVWLVVDDIGATISPWFLVPYVLGLVAVIVAISGAILTTATAYRQYQKVEAGLRELESSLPRISIGRLRVVFSFNGEDTKTVRRHAAEAGRKLAHLLRSFAFERRDASLEFRCDRIYIGSISFEFEVVATFIVSVSAFVATYPKLKKGLLELLSDLTSLRKIVSRKRIMRRLGKSPRLESVNLTLKNEDELRMMLELKGNSAGNEVSASISGSTSDND